MVNGVGTLVFAHKEETMTVTAAALATVVLLFILLAIVAAYGVHANWKLQKEIDAEGDEVKND